MKAFHPTDSQILKIKKSVIAWAGLAALLMAIAYISQDVNKVQPKSGNSAKAKQVTQPKAQDQKATTDSSDSSQKLRVTVSGLNMRSAPTSADENVVAQLKSDDILEVLSKEGNWWKVKTSTGQIGYVFDSENFIEVVK